jgi:hypothetical protein
MLATQIEQWAQKKDYERLCANTATDYTTTLFGKRQRDKALVQTMFQSLSTLPSVTGTGTIKSNMPATIAETVFITNDKEGQLLSEPPLSGSSSNARQQQIVDRLKAGTESYLSSR